MPMKRVVAALLAIVAIAVLGVLAYSQRSTIAARLMERGLEARMGGNIVDDLEDGRHLAPNLVHMMKAAARKLDNQIMAKITHDIMDYHASPVEAAETARDAGVGHLLYYLLHHGLQLSHYRLRQSYAGFQTHRLNANNTDIAWLLISQS